ncbi:hypothetical protein PISL3812_07196 [Talaromyces islandicus]|uniref:Uncharacterized protein n=1 Tax=Talaromyces islandicus TaxID=28573 RepID=A0A0U1M3Q3_TALIS|nr:hypothetical protein PISL3812_07196 [Talaromyces islandicus]
MSKPNYPGGETPKNVFLITFFDGGLPKQLGPTRDKIREFLAMQGLHVDVEISVLGYFRQVIFPISASDRAVQTYMEAENGIIGCLNRNLTSRWEGLSLFNIGFTQDKITPTIVVYVPPTMSFDWATLRMHILALTISYPDINVAVHPGAVTGAVDTESLPGAPGDSIGTKGSGSSGTLGGYFDLEIHGETDRKRASALGSSPTHDDESRCEVMSPSEEDVTTDIDQINASRDNLKVKKAELVKKDDEYKSLGISKKSLSSRITEVTQSIQIQEEKLQKVKNSLPYTLGKVLLSSGTAWYDGQVSDWAFVELEAGRLAIPNTMPLYNKAQARDFRNQPSVAEAGAPATGFGKIQLGQIYLKNGRATGVTVGVCNGVHLFVPKHVRHVRGISWTPLLPLDNSFPGSREFLIIPTSGTAGFCQPGDSGSLVYDIHGKICGLLFGGLKDELVAAPAVVTAFPNIIEAIKEKGGVLTDPNVPPYEEIEDCSY